MDPSKRWQEQLILIAKWAAILGPMLLAAWMATHSQGGGITPATAFFCPLFGPFSFVLFEPNRGELSDFPPLLLAGFFALLACMIWAKASARSQPPSRRRTLAIAAGVIAYVLWAAIGLVRVAYSMA